MRDDEALGLDTTPHYREWPIAPALAGRVVCTWRDPGQRTRRAVLPDACMDLIWDGSSLLVAGPDTAPASIETPASIDGLRFRPGAAAGFLGVPADELRDRRVPLADLWGRAADELAERLAASPRDARRVLEGAVLARLPAAAPPDPLITALLQAVGAEERAFASLRALARELGTDERTLRRRCARALGYGPKTLERIVRFRRALRLGRAGLPPLVAATAAGYADQAHFTRECRRLAGVAPGALFADGAVILSTTA